MGDTMRSKIKNRLRETDVLLASYPRSGSTWARRLLADVILQIHGIDTSECSAWFEDRIIPDFYRDDLDRIDPRIHLSYRLIKTHETFYARVRKTVYIFRRPADALCSYYHYHINFVERFTPYGIDAFCLDHLSEWRDHVQSYVGAHKKNGNNIFFLSYEWLQQDTPDTLFELARFLGLSVDIEMCQSAAAHHTFQKCRKDSTTFFRKGAVGSSAHELTETTLQLINREIDPPYREALRFQPSRQIHENIIEAAGDLSNIEKRARNDRYGNWKVEFQRLIFHCNDLLSFYMAAKDIFIHQIYAFDSDHPAPTVIDGGGHIGLFTVFVKQRYPNAKVTVFEPDPPSVRLLAKNLSANKIEDVTLIKAGLSKQRGTADFFSDGSDGSSLFSDMKNATIRVVPLSAYIGSEVDCLKINIEGAELDVLSEIETKLPLVKNLVIEYHGFPNTGQNLHKILALLDRAGFRYMIHDFDAETNPATKPPFRLDKDTRFYLLIFAARTGPPHRESKERSSLDKKDRHREPVSRLFGIDRGTPIDRYLMERFLEKNAAFIRGRVLEFGDDTYTRKYGTQVTRCDVLSVVDSGAATICGDLSTGRNVPRSAFDCIIMTQTLQMIYDVRSAIKHTYRALKPGGCLLLTASGISQISRFDMDRWGEYWRFTDLSLRKLLEASFGSENVSVDHFGNFASSVAFLKGEAAEELPSEYFEFVDYDYQLLLTARALRPMRA